MTTIRGVLNALTSMFFVTVSMIALRGIIGASKNSLYVAYSPLPMIGLCSALAIFSGLMLLSYRRTDAPHFGQRFSIIVCFFAVAMSLAGIIILVGQKF